MTMYEVPIWVTVEADDLQKAWIKVFDILLDSNMVLQDANEIIQWETEEPIEAID